MCRPQDRLTEIRIYVDAAGNVAGCGLTHHWQSDHEFHEALDVGPFDTPQQALSAAERRLTIEMPLWFDRT